MAANFALQQMGYENICLVNVMALYKLLSFTLPVTALSALSTTCR